MIAHITNKNNMMEDKNMLSITEKITAELNNRKDRSAWDKGVNVYALELVEELSERIACEKREPANPQELRAWMLNGAASYEAYSYGGCSLICDCDIAERLCAPSELKKTRNGERRPNRAEEWLDVQARALVQASRRICKIYNKVAKEGV